MHLSVLIEEAIQIAWDYLEREARLKTLNSVAAYCSNRWRL
jgi:hypothetical protein